MQEFTLNQLLNSEELRKGLDQEWVKAQIKKYPFDQNWRTLLTKITEGADQHRAIKNASIYLQSGNYSHEALKIGELDLNEGYNVSFISDEDLHLVGDKSEEDVDPISSLETSEVHVNEPETIDTIEIEEIETISQTTSFETDPPFSESDRSGSEIQESGIEPAETNLSTEDTPALESSSISSTLKTSTAAIGSFGLIHRLADWMDENKRQKSEKPIIDIGPQQKKKEFNVELLDESEDLSDDEMDATADVDKKKKFEVELLEEKGKQEIEATSEQHNYSSIQDFDGLNQKEELNLNEIESAEVRVNSHDPAVKQEYVQRIMTQEEFAKSKEKEKLKEHLQQIADKEEALFLDSTYDPEEVDPKVDPMLSLANGDDDDSSDKKKVKMKSKKKKNKKKKKDKKVKNRRWISYTPEDYDLKTLTPFTMWLNQVDNTVMDLTSDLSAKKKKKRKKKKKDHWVLNDDLVSEPLAELLAQQGHRKKAIAMYEVLSLKNPQKSSFFAGKIEELKANKS